MIREIDITNSILDYLNNRQDTYAWKRYSGGRFSSTKGWPDITGVVKLNNIGIRLEIEVKQPGKKPTNLQFARLRIFRKHGALVFWTDNLDNCIYNFETILNYIKNQNPRQFDNKDLLPTKQATIIPDL